MSGNLSRGWSADYLPKKLYLEKKFACSSMLSEALRHVSMKDFSACWPCLCQTVHPQPLHVLKFLSSKECRMEASISWGLVALNCQDKTNQQGMLTCD